MDAAAPAQPQPCGLCSEHLLQSLQPHCLPEGLHSAGPNFLWLNRECPWGQVCWWVFTSCSSLKKKMALSRCFGSQSIRCSQSRGRWNNLRGSLQAPSILLPPGGFCRVKLMGPEKPKSLVLFPAWWDVSCGSTLARFILQLRHLWRHCGVQRICWGSWGNSCALFAVHKVGGRCWGCSSCDAILVLRLLLRV